MMVMMLVVMTVIMRMATGFAGLKDTSNTFMCDGFTVQHLLNGQVVLHKNSFIRKGGFEMKVPDHPTQPGGIFSLAKWYQKTIFRALLD